jgi:hypothetical protein
MAATRFAADWGLYPSPPEPPDEAGCPLELVEYDGVELVECDDCPAMITQEEYDAQDGWCKDCYAKTHFTCKRCHEVNHVDDRGEEFPLCCNSCDSDEHQEIADDLWENQITDLVGSWSGESYEIPRLRKLLAYVKRLNEEK